MRIGGLEDWRICGFDDVMYKILISILLVTINLAGIGQGYPITVQKEIDSLRKLMPGAEIDRQVDIINEMAAVYAPVNFDSSIYYSAQSMRMATIQGYSYGIGCSRLYTGNAYYYRMDFKNALISYLSSQTILEEGDHFEKLGELSMMLGHINFFIMRNDMAVSWYNRALRYMKAAGKETSQGDALYGINMIYWRDGPVDSGLVAGRRYLEFARNYHDRFREATALINLGMVYFDTFYHGDSGLYYHAEALKIAKTMRYEILAGIIYYNMGYNYAFNKKLSDKPDAMHTALYYLDLAASIARKANYNLLLYLVHSAIADIDLIEGPYGQAASNLDLADSFLQLCIRFPYEQPVTANFYSFGRIFDSYLILRTGTDINRSRFELAKKTGQFRDAVRYQQLYFESKDTLRALQQGRQLELIMAESEAERTNQKIQALAQENELNRLKVNQNRLVFAGIAAMVVIISLFLLIYFQRKRLKAEQKSILNE
jgi:hypothetical protein